MDQEFSLSDGLMPIYVDDWNVSLLKLMKPLMKSMNCWKGMVLVMGWKQAERTIEMWIQVWSVTATLLDQTVHRLKCRERWILYIQCCSYEIFIEHWVILFHNWAKYYWRGLWLCCLQAQCWGRRMTYLWFKFIKIMPYTICGK
jgi:hypothetical protein